VPTRRLARGWAVCAAGLLACPAGPGPGAQPAREAPHPFLLWTNREAAEIRARVESDPLAKKQYERMAAVESAKGGNPSLLRLFRFSVLGDAQAGEAEKKALLGFVGKLPPAAKPGNPATGNVTWRDDRTLDALRYDVLYDLLSVDERKGVEETIRAYVGWFKQNPGSHGSRGDRPRTGWLPNMQWPTFAGIHVLAAASRDETLIREVFETPRGWKWFCDVYVADGRFYMEEFSKYGSNIGSLLLWCEGLERLGLSRYGYGYTGKGGATMKNFLLMLIAAGYPRIERPGGAPDYPAVTMGDAADAVVVAGCAADGSGGMAWHHQPMMWGPIPKMQHPLWWEAGHRRFPDAGFDYFLAQLRKPGEEIYLPSLYFGLKPVDPRSVRPPAAPSYVAPERGFALLRAEESPAYWESPKPAVALQFASAYVHYVHDCFAILQFVAHNRMIYTRMGATRGGYAGGDPWRDHVRGLGSGVVVDGLQAQPVDSGEKGLERQRLRYRFDPAAKFVAIRAKPVEVDERDKDGQIRKIKKAVYPDADLERALVLTEQYLFDCFRLAGDAPRVYDWHVLSPASLEAADGWVDLERSPAKDKGARPHLSGIRVRDAGDAPWTAVLLQDHLPRDVGVKVWMLGEPGTLLISGKPPIGDGAGVALMASRRATRTVFAALHEPFERKAARIRRFERIQQTDQGLAVRVIGEDLDDRVLVRFGEDVDQPIDLAGDGERFVFGDYAFVRAGRETVEVFGDLRALSLRVSGSPRLVVNGRARNAKVADGILTDAP
jgi:hypothetical protein